MRKNLENKKLELRKEVIRRFSDSDFISLAIQNAARSAIRMHKLAGNPIASWRDGKVVIVQPEDIVLDESTE